MAPTLHNCRLCKSWVYSKENVINRYAGFSVRHIHFLGAFPRLPLPDITRVEMDGQTPVRTQEEINTIPIFTQSINEWKFKSGFDWRPRRCKLLNKYVEPHSCSLEIPILLCGSWFDHSICRPIWTPSKINPEKRASCPVNEAMRYYGVSGNLWCQKRDEVSYELGVCRQNSFFSFRNYHRWY